MEKLNDDNYADDTDYNYDVDYEDWGSGLFSAMMEVENMRGNYEQRKVANYSSDDKKIQVDTCAITDSYNYPYETAVLHPEYHGEHWIVVEQYQNKAAAQEGHEKWVSIMTTEPLPDELKDVCQCKIKEVLMDNEVLTFKRKKSE